MFTLAEVALWDADEAFRQLVAALPLGWRVAVRAEAGLAIAEVIDAAGECRWTASNPDPRLLYLDGLGWLRVRDHKPHPAWRPREREIDLRVPNLGSSPADPPDLDPEEVAAVYRRKP